MVFPTSILVLKSQVLAPLRWDVDYPNNLGPAFKGVGKELGEVFPVPRDSKDPGYCYHIVDATLALLLNQSQFWCPDFPTKQYLGLPLGTD